MGSVLRGARHWAPWEDHRQGDSQGVPLFGSSETLPTKSPVGISLGVLVLVGLTWPSAYKVLEGGL